MQVHVHYVFLPTAELLDAARLANAEYEVRPSVWSDVVHDRTGAENPRSEIERSFWNVFLAQLVHEGPEPEGARYFRARCLGLGFQGCWSVVETRRGGLASELVEESRSEAEAFLSKHAKLFRHQT